MCTTPQNSFLSFLSMMRQLLLMDKSYPGSWAKMEENMCISWSNTDPFFKEVFLWDSLSPVQHMLITHTYMHNKIIILQWYHTGKHPALCLLWAHLAHAMMTANFSSRNQLSYKNSKLSYNLSVLLVIFPLLPQASVTSLLHTYHAPTYVLPIIQ